MFMLVLSLERTADEKPEWIPILVGSVLAGVIVVVVVAYLVLRHGYQKNSSNLMRSDGLVQAHRFRTNNLSKNSL